MLKWLLIIAVAAAPACSDKKEDAAKKASEPAAAKPAAEAKPVARKATKVDGPSVSPVISNNITFVTPKPGVTWAEMAFPCYKAAVELQEGGSAAAAFYQASPMIEPALKAADIDLEKDVAAIGGWECAENVCVYFAATLRDPKKIGDMVAMIAPDAKTPDPLHWSFGAPGATGPRTIHIRAIPIQWGDSMPGDAWSKDMSRATHVVFLTGVGGGDDVEPLSLLATGAEAAARVKDAESVLADTHNRCVVGTTSASDFKPGFKLEASRFAMGLPSSKSDALTRLMGSDKTLNVEVELSLSAAPKEKDVQGWIEESRQWVAGIAAPLRMQFAAQGEMVNVMFDAGALIATQGFRHEIDGQKLRLSWRTDRVKQADLNRLEADLQRVMGPGGF